MNLFGQRAKAGFTLIELMVYIALLGGIVLIAGQAFSDSTKMRVRTQSMLQTSQDVGNITTIFRQDLAQMGAKSYKNTSGIFVIHDSVFTKIGTSVPEADKDSSSYELQSNQGGAGLDKITMRRIRYTNAGDFEAVEKVSWYVENRNLMRVCATIAGTANVDCPAQDEKTDEEPVIIAENIDKFKIIPGKPTTIDSAKYTNILPATGDDFKLVSRFGDSNFEPLNVEPEAGGPSIRLSGFAMNYDFSSNEPYTNPDLIKANQVFFSAIGSTDPDASWNKLCKKITLEPYIEYEISFAMPKPADDDPSRMFCPGRDHMAVGFRYAEDGQRPEEITDFQFYPPTDDENTLDKGFRRMRFTVHQAVSDVCLGFTFASFSPIASSGNIKLSKVKLRKIPSSNYIFTDTAISPLDKKNVKAMKVEISTSKNGESGTETIIVPVPGNGPKD